RFVEQGAGNFHPPAMPAIEFTNPFVPSLATYSYSHGQGQRSKLTKLQHFHRETPNEPQCVK
ncbi:hypothetical protein, partial [Pseudomonas fluorescens]|uniref:hypothetical protein n=1 Tax=Pseudomonas fluorescens TaxID=294 RepID=UPI003CFEC038